MHCAATGYVTGKAAFRVTNKDTRCFESNSVLNAQERLKNAATSLKRPDRAGSSFSVFAHWPFRRGNDLDRSVQSD